MNIGQLMKQAQMMQRKVNKLKNELDEKVYEIKSNQNMIQGHIKGNLEIIDLSISPELLSTDNKEMLEDMLTVTLNEMISKIQKERDDTLDKLTNGVDVSMFM